MSDPDLRSPSKLPRVVWDRAAGELDVRPRPSSGARVDEIARAEGDAWIDCNRAHLRGLVRLDTLDSPGEVAARAESQARVDQRRPMVRRAMDVLKITELSSSKEAP